MSKTVHPYSFRIGIIRGWKSRWFSGLNYRKFLKADVSIHEHLEKILKGMYVNSIEIERASSVFHIIIKTSRPGFIIGRKGEGVEKLRSEVIKKANKLEIELPRDIKISIEEVEVPEENAKIVAHMIVESLEKRMPFRRAIKQALEKSMSCKNVKGIKVALSGRLGGAEMSRREWARKGRIPLQTLRADIDFARERALMSYGVIGVKVWIFRGEKV